MARDLHTIICTAWTDAVQPQPEAAAPERAGVP